MQDTDAPARRNTNIWALIVGSEATNWSRRLVREHLGPAARLALFQTCPGARDMVLGAADKANMRVSLALDEDNPSLPVSMASVQAVKDALRTRGKLTTSLQLHASTLWLLSIAQGMLHGAMTWLDRLTLVVPGDQQLPTTTLATLAHSCPNLRVLCLDAPVDFLPSINCLPKLEGLYIIDIKPDNAEGLLRTTGPYVNQLTDLLLTTEGLAGPAVPELDPTHLPLLLNPANPGVRLHTLHLSTTLNDTLLDLLLAGAPVLQHLTVSCMQLESDTYKQAEATWQELTIETTMHLSSLARLPLTTDMTLRLRTASTVTCDVTTAQAASEVRQTLSRFKDVKIWLDESSSGQLVLVPAGNLHPNDAPVAWRAGIGLLHACTTTSSTTELVLGRWVMSPEIMLELPALPAWGQLQLWKLAWPQQPQRYTTLLRLLPGSFREVLFNSRVTLTPAHYEIICLGAPVCLPAEAPLLIRVYGCEVAVVDAIRQMMEQMRVYPNVTISHLGENNNVGV